jgi:RNA polymerase sigma factor (sigma-70 family)
MLLDVHRALRRLETLHPQHGRVVELRFFGGMSDAEIAGVLGISERTVRRNWNSARAWLSRELSASGAEAPDVGTAH